MQFARALSQELYFFGIHTANQFVDESTGRRCFILKIGFAFQNILQNFLAGILLLLQEPFRLGDIISVTGIEGNVADIQARATVVTTKEGRQVVIPNAVIFTNPVAVAHAEAGKS